MWRSAGLHGPRNRRPLPPILCVYVCVCTRCFLFARTSLGARACLRGGAGAAVRETPEMLSLMLVWPALQDPRLLQWPDSFAIDQTGNLLVVTNKLQNFLRNRPMDHEPTYRVLRAALGVQSYLSGAGSGFGGAYKPSVGITGKLQREAPPHPRTTHGPSCRCNQMQCSFGAADSSNAAVLISFSRAGWAREWTGPSALDGVVLSMKAREGVGAAWTWGHIADPRVDASLGSLAAACKAAPATPRHAAFGPRP